MTGWPQTSSPRSISSHPSSGGFYESGTWTTAAGDDDCPQRLASEILLQHRRTHTYVKSRGSVDRPLATRNPSLASAPKSKVIFVRLFRSNDRVHQLAGNLTYDRLWKAAAPPRTAAWTHNRRCRVPLNVQFWD